jgi:hypothetical protein
MVRKSIRSTRTKPIDTAKFVQDTPIVVIISGTHVDSINLAQGKSLRICSLRQLYVNNHNNNNIIKSVEI